MSVSVRKFSFYLILICFIWFPVQDTILSLLYQLYPSIIWKTLLISKESLILMVLGLLFYRKILLGKWTVSRVEILSVFFIYLCFFYFLFVRSENVAITAVHTTFRSVLLPILFVITGKWLELNEAEIKLLIKVIILVSIFSIIFGFVEMLIPVEKFWNGFLDLYGFLTKIKGLQEGPGFARNVPANFWGSVNIRRMAGAVASPLALGYFLLVPILLLSSNILTIKNKNLILSFLILGLLLTEARAAIAGTIIGITIINKKEFRKALSARVGRDFLIMFLVFVIVISGFILISQIRNFIFASAGVREGRIIGHFLALQGSLMNISETVLVGKGFGSASSWAVSQGSKIAGAGESAYLSIMYQIGGIGLGLFLLWWYFVFARLKRIQEITKNDFLEKISKAFICINIIYFFTGFISEQILTFTSVAHFWILTGAILGMRSIGKHEYSAHHLEI